MLFRFHWDIDKLALGVRLGSGLISKSPLNNAKRICNQKEVFCENPLEKKPDKKFHGNFVTIIFNPRDRKTKKMKVLRE